MSRPPANPAGAVQQHFEKRLVVFLCVCLLIGVAVLMRSNSRRRAASAEARKGPANAAAWVQPVVRQAGESRAYYRFSVIPGGAFNAGELTAALDRDAVAARHYGRLRRSSLKTVASPFSEPVYVSYRVGDAIYWTARPLPLHQGELLLTDGTSYARARCGNRVEPTPQAPVRASTPSPEEMEQADAPPATLLASILPDMLPLPAGEPAVLMPLVLPAPAAPPIMPGSQAGAGSVVARNAPAGAAGVSGPAPVAAYPAMPVGASPPADSPAIAAPSSSPSPDWCCVLFAAVSPWPTELPDVLASDFGLRNAGWYPAGPSAPAPPAGPNFLSAPLPSDGLSSGPGPPGIPPGSAPGAGAASNPPALPPLAPAGAAPRPFSAGEAPVPASTPEPAAALPTAIALAAGWLFRKRSTMGGPRSPARSLL